MDRRTRLTIERDQLVKRLAEIDRVLEEYIRIDKLVDELVGSLTPDILDPTLEKAAKAQPVVSATSGDSLSHRGDRRSVSNAVREFENAARSVFLSAIRPLDRVEVLEGVTALGVEVGGEDAKATTSARLSRMPGVKSLRGYGYWLEEREHALQGLPPRPASEAKEASEDGPLDGL